MNDPECTQSDVNPELGSMNDGISSTDLEVPDSDDAMSDVENYAEPGLDDVIAQYLEFNGESVTEVLSGIRESIDAQSKCILRLTKAVTKLAEKQ